MSYNPSALAAAMNRSLKFENIISTTGKLLNISSSSEYKLHIQDSANHIVDVDILGDKIVRVNSNADIDKEFGLKLENNHFYVNGLISPFNLEVEYSFDNFEINTVSDNNDSNNFETYNFGEQYFYNLRTTNLKTAETLNINNLETTEIIANKIKLGNWAFTANAGNEIQVTYNNGV